MASVYDKQDVRLYLHVVQDFEERECHSTADNHLIYFVQQILNQQNLVRHLCTVTQNTAHNVPIRSRTEQQNPLKARLLLLHNDVHVRCRQPIMAKVTTISD